MSGLSGGLVVVLLLAALIAPGLSCKRAPSRQNRAPAVPGLPQITRVELNRFQLTWEPAVDDDTPPQEIRYDVGVVSTNACVVVQPAHRVIGPPELAVTIPLSEMAGPLVGFAVRSLDRAGRSYGYGACAWTLRSPIPVPRAFAPRWPRLPPAASAPASFDCRGDGGNGAWCATAQQVAHFGGRSWDVLNLPIGFEPTDWTALDAFDVLARSGEIELQLSRASGVHLRMMSPGNELFDGGAGAVSTGRELAFLVVRGYVGEFAVGHIDMAGPPEAMGLPTRCRRILQLGQARTTAFALCSDRAESDRDRDDGPPNVLLLGEGDRRRMRWSTPIEVDTGRRVGSLVGTRGHGLAVLTGAGDLEVLRWDETAVERTAVEPPEGMGPTLIVAGGPLELAVMLVARDDTVRVHDGLDWETLSPDRDGRLLWMGTALPRAPRFVGTTDGILVIGAEGVVRLRRSSAEWLRRHPRDSLARRALDNRHYVAVRPHFDSLFSSRDGLDWHRHPWQGPEFEPVDVAVLPTGSVYLSGWRHDGPARRASLRRLGDDEVERLPEGFQHPPRLATDRAGALYATSGTRLAALDGSTGEWRDIAELPDQASGLVGVQSGVLVATAGRVEGRVSASIQRCGGAGCQRISLPENLSPATELRLLPTGGTLCVVGRVGDAWRLSCGSADDLASPPRATDVEPWTDYPLRFRPDTAEAFGLGEVSDWRIVDATPLGERALLIALESDDSGFVALADPTGPARLLAEGLTFAEGEVLLAGSETGLVHVIEVDGPVRLDLFDARVGIPDWLY